MSFFFGGGVLMAPRIDAPVELEAVDVCTCEMLAAATRTRLLS